MKNRKFLKLIGIILIVVLAAACVSGCKGCKEEKKEKQETTEDPHRGQSQSYLTGLWIDDELANKRPVAIMFNNIYEGCPQSGIGKASVIYESPVEGGICRLMGLFEDYSGLDRIGSLRSARTYFPKFAYEYDAFFLHHGQAVYALEALEMMDDLDCMGEYSGLLAFRSTDREAPHNSYTKPDMIDQTIEAYGYRREYNADQTSHFKFVKEGSKANMASGISATTIEPGYPSNHPSFVYNEVDGLYYRNQYGEKHIDELTGNQLTCKNVIFENCDYTMYETSSYLNIDVASGGKGMYFTDGKGIDITWEKEGEWGVTHYYDLEGNEIELNPGVTWVCVILNPDLGSVSIS